MLRSCTDVGAIAWMAGERAMSGTVGTRFSSGMALAPEDGFEDGFEVVAYQSRSTAFYQG